MLQKYIFYPSHILDVELVQTVDMTYEVELVQILDRKQHLLHNKMIFTS